MIINGPNLNLLGKREPEIYGSLSFEEVLTSLKSSFPEITLSYFQSNDEARIIEQIHEVYLAASVDGLVINLGAFTHYSYAIYDALKMADTIPKVEVHISHIYQREAFRHTSVTAPACDGLITGLGMQGYDFAIQYLLKRLS